MTQRIGFYIEGSLDERPNSTQTIYVDGTAGNEFRKGVDVELSHWRPNKTEERYRAGTSTEICFKYLHLNRETNYDLVINNHLDVDGILSVFTLTHPQEALANEDEIIQAAEAGDFWAWAEGTPFTLFQELSLLFRKLESSKMSLTESYQHCFTLIINILQNQKDTTEAITMLEKQCALVQTGKIIREKLTERVVSYHVPKTTSMGNEDKYLLTAKFNEPISTRLAFWPQVRNRRDGQKLQLVSVETENGTHYDLWLPGYCWADTSGLWQPPGLIPAKSMEDANKLQWTKLSQTVGELNALEQNSCLWNLFSGFNFANSGNPRDFPIILSTVSQRNGGSGIPLETVKNNFRLLGV